MRLHTSSRAPGRVRLIASLVVLVTALATSALAAGASVITEFPVPTAASSPLGIAAGPDGALWFTEFGADKIGRITTAGVVSEFAVPTAGASPFEIAAGPDGALWFTEFSSGNIGRITTAGVVSEFV